MNSSYLFCGFLLMASRTPIMAKRKRNINIVVNVPMFPKINNFHEIKNAKFLKLQRLSRFAKLLTHAANDDQIEDQN